MLAPRGIVFSQGMSVPSQAHAALPKDASFIPVDDTFYGDFRSEMRVSCASG